MRQKRLGDSELHRRARNRDESRRLDLRRRHAALARRLLALPAAEAAALLTEARRRLDKWERDRLCSEHYIVRWRERLRGSVRRAAAALVEHDEWTDALLQSSPWVFALEPAAAPRLGDAIRRALAGAPGGLGLEREQPAIAEKRKR